MPGYSLDEIKVSYGQKAMWEKQFPINYLIVRPLSFYLTYVVLKLTESPARVATFGFALGLTGCVLLASMWMWGIWAGIALLWLYSISDAVDGNIARTTHGVTIFGKYLDGLLGDIIDGCYFFFLGVGLYFSDAGGMGIGEWRFMGEHERVLPLFLGAIILICRLWATVFETRYESYCRQKEGAEPFDRSKAAEVIGTSRFSGNLYYLVFINFSCLNNQLVLLMVAAALHLEMWFLVLFASFFAARAVAYFFYFLFRGREKLSI